MRAAYYALRPGGWRDYVTLIHWPYTLWNLSYVVIGAALAPEWLPLRLGAGLAAFFLGLGVAAHAFDELHGRPLRTEIPSGVLWALGIGALAGAVAIGVVAAIAWTPWLLLFVAAGGFMVVAYNLELVGGRFHGDWQLAVSWGATPFVAAFGVLLILAQRRLSTPIRAVRRTMPDVEDAARAALIRGAEDALQAMAGAVVCLAIGLAILRAA